MKVTVGDIKKWQECIRLSEKLNIKINIDDDLFQIGSYRDDIFYRFETLYEVYTFLKGCDYYLEQKVKRKGEEESEFIILDCGDYNLMVSDWIGDSSNYDDTYVTWDEARQWVDDNCNKVKLGGFDDWVVPTKDELNLIYENKSKFTGKDKFTAVNYWSSSESSTTNAWRQYFNNGYQSSYIKTNFYRVRAVRRINNKEG